MFKETDDKSQTKSKIVLTFLLSCLVVYLVELGVTHSMEIQAIADSVFNLRSIYQRLITAGPRELRQNYTVLVDINPEKDPKYKSVTQDSGNPCGAKGTRNTLAQLLDKVAEQKPAVIVIDKFFSAACDSKDPGPGTKRLAETLQRVSRQTPVVVGRLAPYDTEDAEHGETPPVLEASQPSLTFKDNQEQQKPGICEGIVNLDLDNRKMALKWLVRRNKSSQPEEISTLSFTAVKTYYETQSAQLATENPEIIKLLKLDKNPYISFIERSKFELIPAGALITSGSFENFSRLRGKIVIIGESSNQFDMHDSVFYSKIPGFILQANYIEAMLDQRYYKSIPWLDYIIGFLVFATVYFCEHEIDTLEKFNILLKFMLFLCAIGAILGCIFLLLYLAVVLFGLYINPVTISLLGITIIITHPFLPKHQLHPRNSVEKDQEVTNDRYT